MTPEIILVPKTGSKFNVEVYMGNVSKSSSSREVQRFNLLKYYVNYKSRDPRSHNWDTERDSKFNIEILRVMFKIFFFWITTASVCEIIIQAPLNNVEFKFLVIKL